MDLMIRVSEATDKIVLDNLEIKRKHLKGRVAHVLLYFANYIYNSDEFELPISRREIAEYIGMTTENVIRTLSEFRKDKIIKIFGKDIQIADKKRLENISEFGWKGSIQSQCSVCRIGIKESWQFSVVVILVVEVFVVVEAHFLDKSINNLLQLVQSTIFKNIDNFENLTTTTTNDFESPQFSRSSQKVRGSKLEARSCFIFKIFRATKVSE